MSRVLWITSALAFLCICTTAQGAPPTSFMMQSPLFEENARVIKVAERPPTLEFVNSRTAVRLSGLTWRNWGATSSRATGAGQECSTVDGVRSCGTGTAAVEVSRPILLRCGARRVVVGRYYSRFSYAIDGNETTVAMAPACPAPGIASLTLRPSGPSEWFAEASFCDRRGPARSRHALTWSLISSSGRVLDTQRRSVGGVDVCRRADVSFFFTLSENYRVRLTVRNLSTGKESSAGALSRR